MSQGPSKSKGMMSMVSNYCGFGTKDCPWVLPVDVYWLNHHRDNFVLRFSKIMHLYSQLLKP